MAVINLAQVASPSAPSASTDNVFIDTSGNLSVQKPDGNIVKIAAAGTYTLTIPATGTAALLGTAQTFSAAQTFSNRLVAPGMQPASDGTAALTLTDAGGTPVLTVDTTNDKVTAAGDLFARADTYGLFDRIVNTGGTPTDHFTAASLDGGWAWAGSPFGGTASGIDLTLPSCLRLLHSSITDDLFLYRAGSDVIARLCVVMDSYVGVRVDDGSTDNSLEFRIQANTANLNTLTVVVTTAGTPASTTAISSVVAEWWMLRVHRFDTVAYAHFGKNTPVLGYVGGTTGISWTPTRAGIVFGQRGAASNLDRIAWIDWVAIS